MTPDFRELVGDLPEEERARLERVHDLLVAAGPPPELPPAIREPAAEPETVVVLPRRRAGALLALAAAIALVAFVGGFVAGHIRGNKFATLRTVPMHGTAAAQDASATIDVGSENSGNWPLRVVVRNLPRLPRGGYYEMYLTRHGKLLASCGTFAASGNKSSVRLNAPYDLKSYDGWVVTRNLPGVSTDRVVLTTSV
jgi:hypothetical protein